MKTLVCLICYTKFISMGKVIGSFICVLIRGSCHNYVIWQTQTNTNTKYIESHRLKFLRKNDSYIFCLREDTL